MRSFILSSVLLGTVLCFANHAGALNQTDVDALWEEARNCYKEKLLNSTIEGDTTPARRRGTKTTPESEIMSENSNIYPFFEKLAMERHHLTKRQAANQNTPAACQQPGFDCSRISIRWRNIDGTCNNLNNPRWGSRNLPFSRVARPAYEDGSFAPRGGFNSRLPNPRWISTQVHFDSNPVNRQVTNMVPQFGQFLDHDITMTPEAASGCCANPRSNVDCWAIQIPSNDPFYSQRAVSQRCMDFTRSTTCNTRGVREQVNANTAFIDGSQVYGSDPQRTQALRAFQGGRLATNPSLAGFLPNGQSRGLNVQGTFVAGDDRINEMPGLAVMHNVFLMEHNRIANELVRVWRAPNNAETDELAFQEAKRINIALLQQVTYSEYLPIVLGQAAMSEYGLWLPNQGYSSYNPQVDPTIFNSFATAAYRFGHSMISGIVRLIAGNNQQVGSYRIADHYFQSQQVTQSNGQGYDLILRGLFTQNCPEMDRHVTDGVTNFLFKQPNANFGGDLVARNIQRGRDHGLPSWTAFRSLCGISSPTNWNQQPTDMNPDAWRAIASVYGNNRNVPEDVDLFVGGLGELPARGGLTGPTFQCLKAVQFQRLKDGDRYFFTHSAQNTRPFTSQQLAEIRNQRLSDIICRNSQQNDAPANAFLIPSGNNPMQSCASRRPMNLAAFPRPPFE